MLDVLSLPSGDFAAEPAERVWLASLEGGLEREVGRFGAAGAWFTSFPLRLPFGPTVRPFRSGACLRPPAHRRAWYFDVSSLVSSPRATGLLAFKGTEPHSPDWNAWMLELATERLHVEATLGDPSSSGVTACAELSVLEKLALVEHKVPGSLLVSEALAEAQRAWAFQSAYVGRHGEAARAPLPLAVYRWPDEVSRRVEETLAPLLSRAARGIVHDLCAGGLGAYVYLTRCKPTRVAHLSVAPAGRARGYADRVMDLRALVDPEVTILRWIELVARMLALGFIPKDPASVLSGDCLQHQNASIDGGLADLGSVVHVDAFGDDRALRSALRSVRDGQRRGRRPDGQRHGNPGVPAGRAIEIRPATKTQWGRPTQRRGSRGFGRSRARRGRHTRFRGHAPAPRRHPKVLWRS